MTDRQWPDLAGRIIRDESGQRHVLPVRVYFEDTDAGGVVYHASFVRFAERGRTDFLRLLGTDARRLIDGSDSREPAAFVVRRMNVDFFRPGRMDDLLAGRDARQGAGRRQRHAHSDDHAGRQAPRRSRGDGRARFDFGQAACA